MSHATFYHIVDRIHNQLTKKAVMEEPVLPDFRFAVTVTCCGLAKATVCVIISERC